MPFLASIGSTNLKTIHLSSSENCSLECFLDQYIDSRDIPPASQARWSLLKAIDEFPSAERVSLYELNAWLDSRLQLRALHPQNLSFVDETADQKLNVP